MKDKKKRVKTDSQSMFSIVEMYCDTELLINTKELLVPKQYEINKGLYHTEVHNKFRSLINEVNQLIQQSY